ncbi:MAG: hypothetical protein WED00_05800 [Aquisalimonadaceae bacterium]
MATEQPTKAQWAAVERHLVMPGSSAKLLVDGFELTLQVHRAKGLRNTIVVFINGVLEWRISSEDCEERRRFWRLRERRLYPKSEADATQKKHGKRFRQQLGMDKTLTLYSPDWPSFTPLRRHLAKNNTHIQLVVREYDNYWLEGVDLSGAIHEATAEEVANG